MAHIFPWRTLRRWNISLFFGWCSLQCRYGTYFAVKVHYDRQPSLGAVFLKKRVPLRGVTYGSDSRAGEDTRNDEENGEEDAERGDHLEDTTRLVYIGELIEAV